MKKAVVVLTAIIVLTLSACKNDTTDDGNSDIIGIWKSGEKMLEITSTQFTFFGDDSGTWIRDGNTLNLRTGIYGWDYGTGLLTNGTLLLWLKGSSTPIEFTKQKNTTSDATLTIKNQSSVTLSTVIWDNISYGSITKSTSATKKVTAGSSYIYFSMGSTDYRTNEVILVSTGETKSFTFLNSTVVVNLGNSTTGPLVP